MMRICEKKCKVAQAAILAMEILLLPTGLISTLLILKDSTNNSNPFCFLHSLFCNLREHCLRFKVSLLSSPFFICLFINTIVLLILLSSSKFHHRKTQLYDDLFSYDAADINIPAVNAPSLPLSPAGTLSFDDGDTMSGGEGVDVKEHQNPEINEEEEEEEDTIEATWEAISGGGGGEEKQSSKLKKSETWPRPPPPPTGQDTAAPEPLIPSSAAAAAASWKELRKSVTFNDAVSECRRGGLARDLLRSPEEMNKRFDDFIRKVNHELRLQRQESEQRFLDTINRGL